MIIDCIHFCLGVMIFCLIKILEVIGIYVITHETQTEEEEHLHISFHIQWAQFIVSLLFLPIASFSFYKLFEFLLKHTN